MVYCWCASLFNVKTNNSQILEVVCEILKGMCMCGCVCIGMSVCACVFVLHTTKMQLTKNYISNNPNHSNMGLKSGRFIHHVHNVIFFFKGKKRTTIAEISYCQQVWHDWYSKGGMQNHNINAGSCNNTHGQLHKCTGWQRHCRKGVITSSWTMNQLLTWTTNQAEQWTGHRHRDQGIELNNELVIPRGAGNWAKQRACCQHRLRNQS